MWSGTRIFGHQEGVKDRTCAVNHGRAPECETDALPLRRKPTPGHLTVCDAGWSGAGRLAGVALSDSEGSTCEGERPIRGGGATVRGVLDMATINAKRCNPAIKAFAKRLAGKTPKVSIAAFMHRQLATARDNAPWTASRKPGHRTECPTPAAAVA